MSPSTPIQRTSISSRNSSRTATPWSTEKSTASAGVVAESDTSRVRVNNTFDSILESVWDDELKNISERLFDQ